jgi:hypothetical protein
VGSGDLRQNERKSVKNRETNTHNCSLRSHRTKLLVLSDYLNGISTHIHRRWSVTWAEVGIESDAVPSASQVDRDLHTVPMIWGVDIK